MKFEIVTPKNRTPEFQAELDALLASKPVKKALPWTKDEPTKTWIIARIDGAIVGFAAIRLIPKGYEFCSLYVDPAHRGSGLADALIEERFALVDGRRAAALDDRTIPVEKRLLRVVCNPDSLNAYLRRGFKKVAMRGKQFTVVERKAA